MGNHPTPYISQNWVSEEKGLLALPIPMNLLRVDYSGAVDQDKRLTANWMSWCAVPEQQARSETAGSNFNRAAWFMERTVGAQRTGTNCIASLLLDRFYSKREKKLVQCKWLSPPPLAARCLSGQTENAILRRQKHQTHSETGRAVCQTKILVKNSAGALRGKDALGAQQSPWTQNF